MEKFKELGWQHNCECAVYFTLAPYHLLTAHLHFLPQCDASCSMLSVAPTESVWYAALQPTLAFCIMTTYWLRDIVDNLAHCLPCHCLATSCLQRRYMLRILKVNVVCLRFGQITTLLVIHLRSQKKEQHHRCIASSSKYSTSSWCWLS